MNVQETRCCGSVQYVTTSATVNQAIWLRKILANMGRTQDNLAKVIEDSTLAINVATYPVYHTKTKHMKKKFNPFEK